jgi:hypothetical protein
MASGKEITLMQRELLIKYLRLNKEFPNNPAVLRLINDMVSTMDEEDVALVEKKINLEN